MTNIKFHTMIIKTIKHSLKASFLFKGSWNSSIDVLTKSVLSKNSYNFLENESDFEKAVRYDNASVNSN